MDYWTLCCTKTCFFNNFPEIGFLSNEKLLQKVFQRGENFRDIAGKWSSKWLIFNTLTYVHVPKCTDPPLPSPPPPLPWPSTIQFNNPDTLHSWQHTQVCVASARPLAVNTVTSLLPIICNALLLLDRVPTASETIVWFIGGPENMIAQLTSSSLRHQ